MIETQRIDRNIITARQEQFQRDEKLAPPRAMTSEGEIILAKPGANVPPGALAGSPVSGGTAEGRARVIIKLEEAKMEKGDILVAPYRPGLDNAVPAGGRSGYGSWRPNDP